MTSIFAPDAKYDMTKVSIRGYEVNEITEDMALEYVEKNGLNLVYFCDDYEQILTQKICDLAVEKHVDSIMWVPKRFLTNEICMKAISKNGLHLMYVPNDLQTTEMCLEAVKHDGLALAYVYKELQNDEICDTAVKQNEGSRMYINTKKD